MTILTFTTIVGSNLKSRRNSARLRTLARASVLALAFSLVASCVLFAREKDAVEYGVGLIVNVPVPEGEVEQAVQDVAQNGVIRGTKEYNKDQFITGATAISASKAFPEWTGEGKIFYKQRLHAIDPRNFKDGGDVGTLTVRYIIQPGQDEKSAVLKIDAVFAEDFRRVTHASNGSVESAEYKDIHDHIEAAELMKQETAEALQRKLNRNNGTSASGYENSSSSSRSTQITETFPTAQRQPNGAQMEANAAPGAVNGADSPEPQTLQERVKLLRQQTERLVKAPGTPLKSAPFHTASTLRLLATGTEVLIVISSPYWFGVETHEGEHGWVPRDEMEQLP